MEGKSLIEILRLDDDKQRRGLKSDFSYISKFKVWQFDGDTDALIDCVMDNSFISHLLFKYLTMSDDELLDYKKADERKRNFLAECSDSDFEELNDKFVECADNSTWYPHEVMYEQFLNAYVEILEQYNQMSNNAVFLKQHVIPVLKHDKFLSGHEYSSLIRDKDTSNVDPKFIASLKRKGISLEDAEAYCVDVGEKDRFRNELHKELIEYGRKNSFSEEEVMADIVFKYHSVKGFRINYNDQTVDFNLGTLTLTGTAFVLHDMQIADCNIEDFYDSKKRKLAMDVLVDREKYNETYISRSAGSEEDDNKLAEKIIKDNSDLSMSFGFDPIASTHTESAIVYALNVKISLSHINEKIDNPEERLERLAESLK